MANLFHTDKTAYIRDLTSVIARHTAEETNSLLQGYKERLGIFARVMHDTELSQKQKIKLVRQLFEEFREFVMITLYAGGVEGATVYDAYSLHRIGLTKEDLFAHRKTHPLPFDLIDAGEIFIENSTISEKLPCLSLAISQKPEGHDESLVAVAVIRLDNLLHIANRSRVSETFLIDSGGTYLSHSDSQRVAMKKKVNWLPELDKILKSSHIGTTLEYSHEGREFIGGFARLKMAKLLVCVQIPKSAAYITARTLLRNLMGVSLALLTVSAVLSLFWSRRITKPIERLCMATREVGQGKFDVQVKRTSRDEIGDLAESFNQMASELDTREKELKETQGALMQSEKMAAFGQLSAGIAHEVKNPLAGILGFTQLSLRKVDENNPLHKNLSIIEKETKRCKNIIANLLKFSRQDKIALGRADINQVVQDAVTIVDHQLGIHQVQIETDLASPLPPIMGNGNQIQQVLMNLFINAQQAMDGKPGTVRISTRRLESGSIQIRLEDDGPGIPAEIQSHIFEPFYTTKPAGTGTGLGLSVTYGIIKDHKGTIEVESEMGGGAAFIITLPIAADSQDEQLPSEVRISETEKAV
jgi:signal transduction histidine kinase